MNTRTRYLPITDLKEGMVLSQPLTITERGMVTFTLPVDHKLTQQNIEQLALHHAACACVCQDDGRSQEEIEAYVHRQRRRVDMIFKSADMSQPQNLALYQALIGYRCA